LGYQRSGKKCKEKFENVDKYYKRTKEGRTGRQDGKSYRFFSQLEALHAAAPPPPPQQRQGMPVEDPQPLAMARMMLPGAADLGFLSMSSESESDDESDEEEEEEEEEAVAPGGGGREGLGDDGDGDGEGGSSTRKLMAMFEGMMRQVTEKQDAMQRVFLETLEKWEAERTEREEAWRRKEVARINREREQLSKERAAAASRDAALIAFLQRVGGAGGEPVRLSPSSAGATRHDAAAAGLQLVPVPAPRAKAEDAWAAAGGDGSGTTAPSRWPKEEVQALIDLRMEKEEQYNDMGPKGPLWEEIAAGMQRIGYNRSAKRCKEKWENINKYFKKVKESNKRRPEDSKTCPYFHQLDAIYRKKHFAGRGGGGGGVTKMSFLSPGDLFERGGDILEGIDPDPPVVADVPGVSSLVFRLSSARTPADFERATYVAGADHNVVVVGAGHGHRFYLVYDAWANSLSTKSTEARHHRYGGARLPEERRSMCSGGDGVIRFVSIDDGEHPNDLTLTTWSLTMAPELKQWKQEAALVDKPFLVPVHNPL
jgi:hypothetical protein